MTVPNSFLQLVHSVADPDATPSLSASEWIARANCLGVDPALFFPGQGESTKEAKEVCTGCTVRVECLEYAIETGERFGIWGGKSERERRRMRGDRRRAERQLPAPTPLVVVPATAIEHEQDEQRGGCDVGFH